MENSCPSFLWGNRVRRNCEVSKMCLIANMSRVGSPDTDVLCGKTACMNEVLERLQLVSTAEQSV